MKRIVSVLLIALLMLSLTACFGGDEDTSSNAPVSDVQEKPMEAMNVGLIQYASHPALDAIREEFMKRLDEWSFDEGMLNVDYKNANGNPAEAASICQGFVTGEVDMIVAVSTPAAKAAVSAVNGTDVKVVFVAVNNPTEDLGIVNPEAPEGNITGTSDKISAQAIVDLAMKINPAMKNFGIIFDTAETNSVKVVEESRNYISGLEKEVGVLEGVFTEGADYQQVARDLIGQAEVIFLPTDNTVAMHMDAIVNTSKELKKPVIAATDSMVRQGALAAISVDYVELADRSADMVVEILSGTAVSAVPVEVFTNYNTYINQTTLEAVGAVIPEDVMQSAIFYN